MYVQRMFNERFRTRFWQKVKTSSPDNCWLWTAATNPRGQGFFRVHYGRKMDMAYRVSWILKNGRMIKSGKEIIHSCDNPRCVNPDHLSEASHLENMRDMIKKGRDRKNSPKGENQWFAKLTAQKIYEIRKATLSQNKLAKKFGVSQAHISRIQLRKGWSHIT